MNVAVKTFRAGADEEIQAWLNSLPGEVMTVGMDTYTVQKTTFASARAMVCVAAGYVPTAESALTEE